MNLINHQMWCAAQRVCVSASLGDQRTVWTAQQRPDLRMVIDFFKSYCRSERKNATFEFNAHLRGVSFSLFWISVDAPFCNKVSMMPW